MEVSDELAINIESNDNEGSIIHETGHAVDEEMGWSTGPEPAKPERGGWKIYGANYNNCANDMVDDSGGAIKALTPAQRNDVINEMANSMANRSVQNLEENIRKLPWFGGLAGATRRAVLRDRSMNALEIRTESALVQNGRRRGESWGPHLSRGLSQRLGTLPSRSTRPKGIAIPVQKSRGMVC